ncbi:hypothetical protein LMG28688_01660 [Paraburkholderia caffeinitolerans]|uniref:Uncharacterized protein n=1 Tax=Paraburkholderia caffeinitolerans TaxID=1723730 RepID=A0A6J5FMT5_9BURK|nr:hypothetical protein LMG28688_01660 [Paraburkholderia caffeinitolerans]
MRSSMSRSINYQDNELTESLPGSLEQARITVNALRRVAKQWTR